MPIPKSQRPQKLLELCTEAESFHEEQITIFTKKLKQLQEEKASSGSEDLVKEIEATKQKLEEEKAKKDTYKSIAELVKVLNYGDSIIVLNKFLVDGNRTKDLSDSKKQILKDIQTKPWEFVQTCFDFRNKVMEVFDNISDDELNNIEKNFRSDSDFLPKLLACIQKAYVSSSDRFSKSSDDFVKFFENEVKGRKYSKKIQAIFTAVIEDWKKKDEAKAKILANSGSLAQNALGELVQGIARYELVLAAIIKNETAGKSSEKYSPLQKGLVNALEKWRSSLQVMNNLPDLLDEQDNKKWSNLTSAEIKDSKQKRLKQVSNGSSQKSIADKIIYLDRLVADNKRDKDAAVENEEIRQFINILIPEFVGESEIFIKKLNAAIGNRDSRKDIINQANQWLSQLAEKNVKLVERMENVAGRDLTDERKSELKAKFKNLFYPAGGSFQLARKDGKEKERDEIAEEIKVWAKEVLPKILDFVNNEQSNAIIVEKDKKLKEFEQQITELQTAKASFETEKQSLADQLKALSKQTGELTKEKTQLQKKVEELGQKITSLDEKLAAAEKAKTELVAEKVKLTQELKDAKDALDKSVGEVASLKKQLQETNKSNADLTTTNVQLTSDKLDLAKQLETAKQETEALKAGLDEAKLKIVSLNERLQAADEAYNKHEAEKAKFENEIMELKSQLETAKQETEALKAGLDKTKSEEVSLNEKLKAAGEAYSKDQVEKAEFEKEITELKSQLQTEKQKPEASKAELDKSKSEEVLLSEILKAVDKADNKLATKRQGSTESLYSESNDTSSNLSDVGSNTSIATSGFSSSSSSSPSSLNHPHNIDPLAQQMKAWITLLNAKDPDAKKADVKNADAKDANAKDADESFSKLHNDAFTAIKALDYGNHFKNLLKQALLDAYEFCHKDASPKAVALTKDLMKAVGKAAGELKSNNYELAMNSLKKPIAAMDSYGHPLAKKVCGGILIAIGLILLIASAAALILSFGATAPVTALGITLSLKLIAGAAALATVAAPGAVALTAAGGAVVHSGRQASQKTAKLSDSSNTLFKQVKDAKDAAAESAKGNTSQDTKKGKTIEQPQFTKGNL